VKGTVIKLCSGTKLRCPFCDRTYGYETNLRAHIRQRHQVAILRILCPDFLSVFFGRIFRPDFSSGFIHNADFFRQIFLPDFSSGFFYRIFLPDFSS
jgi:hypothetical protein